MKKKRGRPLGKKYPQPDNIFKAMWNVEFGKLGVSAAMHIAIMCPYRDYLVLGGGRTQVVFFKKNKERRYREKWNSEIGKMVGEKIAAGDYTFFHDLAAAIETLTDQSAKPHSIQRLLALEHKFDCELCGQPFTLKGLRAFYNRHRKVGTDIDSSQLSRFYRWAKSAQCRMLPVVPRQQR